MRLKQYQICICFFRSTEEEEEDNPTDEVPTNITITTTVPVENESLNQEPCNVAALNQFWPKVIEDVRKIGTVRRFIIN